MRTAVAVVSLYGLLLQGLLAAFLPSGPQALGPHLAASLCSPGDTSSAGGGQPVAPDAACCNLLCSSGTSTSHVASSVSVEPTASPSAVLPLQQGHPTTTPRPAAFHARGPPAA